MSVVRWINKTRCVVRCDGCGKLTSNANGEYVRRGGSAGYIHGQGFGIDTPECDGLGCRLDWCEECAGEPQENGPCPKCICRVEQQATERQQPRKE